VATGLTLTKSDVVKAPYVVEFLLALECKVIHINKITSKATVGSTEEQVLNLTFYGQKWGCFVQDRWTSR
jgi:flavin reductase (DIM6/NTAB) family NADH-FMN oxidoreductase RutF